MGRKQKNEHPARPLHALHGNREGESGEKEECTEAGRRREVINDLG